jgi:hypothetical protein
VTPNEACRVIARNLLARFVEDADWESVPEVGESDWLEICRVMLEILDDPTYEEFAAAYAILEARADK